MVRPSGQRTEDAEAGLDINVVFTSVTATIEALRKAAQLAKQLSARVVLLAPQVIPYPLALESPPVLLDWNKRRFHLIAAQSPIETQVQIYLCRDREQTLQTVLKPRSIVVVGGSRRRVWWPTKENRLARFLRHAGHQVIFAEVG